MRAAARPFAPLIVAAALAGGWGGASAAPAGTVHHDAALQPASCSAFLAASDALVDRARAVADPAAAERYLARIAQAGVGRFLTASARGSVTVLVAPVLRGTGMIALWSPTRKTVIVDPTFGSRAYSSLVHELLHAHRSQNGRGAGLPPGALAAIDQGGWVARAVDEEAEAHAAEIEFAVTLAADGDRTVLDAIRTDAVLGPMLGAWNRAARGHATGADAAQAGFEAANARFLDHPVAASYRADCQEIWHGAHACAGR